MLLSLIASALKKLGVDVTLVTDANFDKLRDEITRFGDKLANIQGRRVAFFYYAGRGLEQDGVNYIVLTSAIIKKSADIEFQAFRAHQILSQMGELKAMLKSNYLRITQYSTSCEITGRRLGAFGISL